MKTANSPAAEPIRTLKLSLLEGSFYYIMLGFGESYFSAYILWLNADSFALALLSTLPLVVGSVLQMYTTQMVAWFGTRLRFIVGMAFVQGLCYLPLLLIRNALQPVLWAIVIVVIYQTVFRIHVPAWNSMMADHVREAERGEYFGFHKRVTHIFILLSSFASGWLLWHYQKKPDAVFTGYFIVFVVAFVARMLSTFLFTLHHEAPMDFKQFVHFKFRRDVRLLWQKGHGQHVLYFALLSFGQYISVPFFAMYMLNVLHFDYFQYGIINAVAIAGRILFSPAWGLLSDKYGCKKVILISGFGVALMALLWVFWSSFTLVLVMQVLAGFFWSGFELAWLQIVMDTTTPSNRTQIYTLQQFVGSVAMLLGSLLGGYIISFDRTIAKYYLIVFALSFVGRLLPLIGFARRFHDVPHKRDDFRYRDFAGTFLSAFRERGLFYIPNLLRRRTKL